jgi:hypothetical protein
MTALGWALRIVGGLIIIFGWFAYADKFGEIALFQNIATPIILTVVGAVLLFLGGMLGKPKKG